ncbi:class I SAM-dependent DNA methyltransferase [Providencia manganoxydans]|uniref:class I SAM-dependent DNA methyltransferase n=1 Tax=Providencia manganoxydans TaxID=2923283 RepID=UPI0029C028A6|nr:class I SAM-dependent DNA methyltransferase [Providencia manganoxydans]MDX4945921.1 class I SAM-dependent DNA methyltransferase [Providencia manganoxydans]
MFEMTMLKKSLWHACDFLKEKIGNSTYQGYIFSMLLLKYVSDLKKNYTENYFLMREVISRIPDEASFYHIYNKNIYSTLELGEEIDNSLKSIEKAINSVNKSSDEGLFESIQFDSIYLGEKSERGQTLYELLTIFSQPEMSFSYDDNHKIKLACDYLFEKFSSDFSGRGLDISTPKCISLLIAELLQLKPEDKICDPTCGSGSLLITLGEKIQKSYEVSNYTLFGQEINRSSWVIAKINMFLHNELTSRIEWGDVISNPKLIESDNNLMKFDVVASNPPFNVKGWKDTDLLLDMHERFKLGLPPQTKGDYAFILHIVSTLKDKTGRAAVLAPHGVLFRGGQERIIRKNLIEKNLLDAVIGLPDRLLSGTNIPTVILIFKKDKTNSDVVFIDAADLGKTGRKSNTITSDIIKKISKCYINRIEIDNFSYLANVDEICSDENDYNLNIPRYVRKDEKRIVIDFDELYKEREEMLLSLRQLEMEMNNLIER